MFVALAGSPAASTDSDAKLTGAFPDLEGWSKDGEPELYDPDNLFEYINGAAEVYLSFEFERLATLGYDNERSQSLTVDIYEHADPTSAFGIYSQEKPVKSEFMDIGVQGYLEPGVLNFFQDTYYVKVMVFGLEDDQSLLISVARDVSRRLGGGAGFPAALSCFPKKGKVENSERYFEKNVFGHGFLHSAFVAHYATDDHETRAFIFEATDDGDAKRMLEAYLKMVGEQKAEVIENSGVYRFVDPRLRSSGMVSLKRRGNYIWGIFTDDEALSQSFIGETEKNLATAGLLE